MTKPDEHHHDSSHTEPERVPAVAQTRPRPPTDQPTAPLWTRDFTNLTYEWRRLFSELFGSFLLVMAAAGGPVIQNRSLGQIGRVAEVTAPALTVLAVILFMGAVSGAHLNPIVSVAFALRRDFQWRQSWYIESAFGTKRPATPMRRLVDRRRPGSRPPWCAVLGTDLGTKHRETGQNQWDVAQPAGRLSSFDLRI
ncbi:MAG: aquaporin, partial [Mycobacterium sp.]|jgi:hypothetical protein